MARFYGEITGRAKTVGRVGTPTSGLEGHLRGWNVGVRVELSVDENDNDRIEVYRTTGSNKTGKDHLIAVLGEFEGFTEIN